MLRSLVEADCKIDVLYLSPFAVVLSVNALEVFTL